MLNTVVVVDAFEIIDKSKLIGEIEKRLKEYQDSGDAYYIPAKRELKEILSFINTIEVKNINIDKEIGLFTTNQLLKKRNHSTGIFHLTQSDVDNIAKYFYELGLKAQKGE